MAKKQSSDRMSKLASAVLLGKIQPTQAQTKSLAASVLGQDEKKGLRTKAKPGK